VSATRELEPSLERLLASVLYYGTWLASAVIALGLLMALLGGHPRAMRIDTAGILLLILLPVLRVALMLIVFVRERDYRFGAIAALVLTFIVLGFVLGART
jgi:uncharacterized membrane protein